MSEPHQINMTLAQKGREYGSTGTATWTNESADAFFYPVPSVEGSLGTVAVRVGFVFQHPGYNHDGIYDLESSRLFTDDSHSGTLAFLIDQPIDGYALFIHGVADAALWEDPPAPSTYGSTLHQAFIEQELYLVQAISTSTWVPFGAGYALSLTLNFDTEYRVPVSWVGNTPVYDSRPSITLNQLMRDPAWSGKFAFGFFQIPGTSPATTTVAVGYFTMTSWEIDFWTGEAGGRAHTNQRVRVARDGRYGMPAYASDLVEDKYRPGLWVRPGDDDPEDPPAEYPGNPSEGELDDTPVR